MVVKGPSKAKFKSKFKPKLLSTLPSTHEYLHQLPDRARLHVVAGRPIRLYKGNLLKDAQRGKIRGAVRINAPSGAPRWAAPRKVTDRILSSAVAKQQARADAAAIGWVPRAALIDRFGTTNIRNLNKSGRLPYKRFGGIAHISPANVARLEADVALLPTTVSVRYLAGITGYGRKRISLRVNDDVLKRVKVFGEERVSIPESLESVGRQLEKVKSRVKKAGADAYVDDRHEIIFLQRVAEELEALKNRADAGVPYVTGGGKVLLSGVGIKTTKSHMRGVFTLRRAETRALAQQVRRASAAEERRATRLRKSERKKSARSELDVINAMGLREIKSERARVNSQIPAAERELEDQKAEHARLVAQFNNMASENDWWELNVLPDTAVAHVTKINDVARSVSSTESNLDLLIAKQRALDKRRMAISPGYK